MGIMRFARRLLGGFQRTGVMRLYINGLRRSSLIMGVHTGCPVCLTVAASLVAVETDVGETISAAKVAFVRRLWSVGVVMRLFCPLFPLLRL